LGDDVADILGIKKWQPPENPNLKNGMQVTKKKLNPLFDKYTDIENVKNYNNTFKEGDEVAVLEKVHGASSRYGNLPISINKKQPMLIRLKLWFKKNILKHTHEWIYGSHNVQLHAGNKNKNYYGEDAWGKIAKKYDLKNKIPKDYIVYAELFGYKIQDLTYGITDTDIVVFDIKYKGKYLPWTEVKKICKELNLPTAPQLYVGKYYNGLIESLTDGKSLLCPSQIREGIVIKSLYEDNHPRIGRKILKSVSIDYLNRKGNKTEFH
jgi:RNA ligase (TIGR02306 family)